MDNKCVAVLWWKAQSKSDFHIDYYAWWVVPLKGCVANKVIAAWELRHLLTRVQRGEQPAKQLSGQTPTSQQIQRWSGESIILETPPSSDCFSFNFAETKCFRCTVNHRQREKRHFYRLITYGESTIIFLIRRPGDLWMNPLLRGSLKGGLLQRQPQVIYSIPKFAIYFSPLQPLALTRYIQTIVALCCKPNNELWSRPRQRFGLCRGHKSPK